MKDWWKVTAETMMHVGGCGANSGDPGSCGDCDSCDGGGN